MNASPDQNLNLEPFSRRGSYLNFLRFDETVHVNQGLRGLYLRQCHGARFLKPVLSRITVQEQEPISARDEACLTLTLPDAPGSVRIVFDGTRSIRMLGTGLSLELEFPTAPGASIYAVQDGRWEVNARASGCKLMLESLRGGLEAESHWEGEASSRMRARFSPGPDGMWEGCLDLFDSTWVPTPRRPFADCEAAVRAEFQTFLEGFSPVDAEWEAARARAALVNWSAIVEPSGHFRREAMLMSKHHMSNVWSWDHAFNAMAHIRQDPVLAWDQMMLMADRQNAFGAFPDATNDIHEHFNFCKPPIHGWALSHLRRRNPEFFTEERLKEALSWLIPWTQWWLTHRLWQSEQLPYYLHGNDSGWDNSTFFLKGVPMLTPDLASFLVLQCREIAAIQILLGETQKAEVWSNTAADLLDRLLKRFWNGERFVAVKVPEGDIIEADTLIQTIPLVLGDLLPMEIREKTTAHLQRYLTEWGLATEYPSSPHYTPDGYWRGPIWAPPTLLLVDGLRRGGNPALAREIRTRFLNLCRHAGFAENFNALTGDALRDPAYTWTSSVFLFLLEEDSGVAE